jgi:hypothetical protein
MNWAMVWRLQYGRVKNINVADSIRKSKIDENVFLYYKQNDRLYCVVARHEGKEGFLITAYPTDKVKEGDVIWTK